MNCNQAKRLIALDVSGDVPPNKSGALARHLENCHACAVCRASMEQSRSVTASLREIQPPSGALARMRASVMQQSNAPAEKTPALIRQKGHALVLAVPVAALVFLALVQPHAFTPTPIESNDRIALSDPQPAPVSPQFEPNPVEAEEIATATPLTIRMATEDPNVIIILVSDSGEESPYEPSA